MSKRTTKTPIGDDDPCFYDDQEPDLVGNMGFICQLVDNGADVMEEPVRNPIGFIWPVPEKKRKRKKKD